MWYLISMLAILDLLCLVNSALGMRAQDPRAGFSLIAFFVLTYILLKLIGTWLIYTGSKDIWKDFNEDQ